MAKLIPAEKRIEKAKDLITQARELPVPNDLGWANFSYAARVKDLLRQARELIKLIPYSPSASNEMKSQVKQINLETEQTEKDLLHRT